MEGHDPFSCRSNTESALAFSIEIVGSARGLSCCQWSTGWFSSVVQLHSPLVRLFRGACWESSLVVHLMCRCLHACKVEVDNLPTCGAFDAQGPDILGLPAAGAPAERHHQHAVPPRGLHQQAAAAVQPRLCESDHLRGTCGDRLGLVPLQAQHRHLLVPGAPHQAPDDSPVVCWLLAGLSVSLSPAFGRTSCCLMSAPKFAGVWESTWFVSC